jgi:hypothetical protein
MMLVNTATGQRVLIAKHLAGAWYFPATPESPTIDGSPNLTWTDRLDSAFNAEVDDYGSPQGSTAWRIEYEHEEPELDAELRRRCDSRTAAGNTEVVSRVSLAKEDI